MKRRARTNSLVCSKGRQTAMTMTGSDTLTAADDDDAAAAPPRVCML